MKYLFAGLMLLFSLASYGAPSRVVSLSWEGTEYLLTLGVTPLAIADRDDYRLWVVQPALPVQVLDAGSRLEPNLERIYALKPDLILINPSLNAMKVNLEKIAPTLVLDPFRSDHDNAAAAEKLQRELATRLGRLSQHDAFLHTQQLQLAGYKRQLEERFGAAIPRVCLVRFVSPTTFWAYGENSLPEAAFQALGIKNACPQEKTAWGTRLRKVPDLAQLKPGYLLHIAPFAREAELIRSPLWQALPVVQQKRVRALPAVWTNGGLYSITLMAEIISGALLLR